jgi:hypothetical protein
VDHFLHQINYFIFNVYSSPHALFAFCSTFLLFSGTIMSYCHTCSGGMKNIDVRFHHFVLDRIAERRLATSDNCFGLDPNDMAQCRAHPTACNVVNCVTCSSPDSNFCEDCDSGYYVDNIDGGSCVSCSSIYPNCNDCDSSGCVACANGYNLESGSCVVQPSSSCSSNNEKCNGGHLCCPDLIWFGRRCQNR